MPAVQSAVGNFSSQRAEIWKDFVAIAHNFRELAKKSTSSIATANSNAVFYDTNLEISVAAAF